MKKLSNAQIIFSVDRLKKYAMIKQAISAREKILLAMLGIIGTGALGASVMGGSGPGSGPVEEDTGMGDNAVAAVAEKGNTPEEKPVMSNEEFQSLLKSYGKKNPYRLLLHHDAFSKEQNKKTIEDQFGGDPLMLQDLEEEIDRDPKTGATQKKKAPNTQQAWEQAGVGDANEYGNQLLDEILGRK